MCCPETLPDGATGLRVESVTSGGSGDRAGIQVGDYVVAFAGETVHSTEEILRIRRDLRVGDEVVIRVWRDSGYLDLTMTMRSESGSSTAADTTPSTDEADPQPGADGDENVDVEPR
jgi:serine protease Do